MDDFAEIRKYIAAIFRWWWLIILITLISGLVGFQISARQPPIYRATTTLIVGQSTKSAELTKADIQTSELLALTYADIARRQPLLQEVIKSLNLSDSERVLRKQVDVEPVSGTQLLELSVEAGSLKEAQLIADELARQLILQSPATLENEAGTEKQQFIRQRLESLQAKIENGQQRLDNLEMQMTGSLSINQLEERQQEITKLENLIFDWEESYTQLLIFAESQQSPNQLEVIEPAQGSANPIRPQPKLHTLLAGAVGLLLVLGFIFVREYLDNAIKSTDDLGKQLGITPLGTIRRVKGNDFRERIISQKSFSPLAETYRIIRSNIKFMSIDQPAKSIMITSALPGEGKSTIATNLGIVMAQGDLKTIIVDADLRRPTQHKILEISNSNGLTDFLLDGEESDLNDYLKKTSVKNLYLLTSGVLPNNPSELLDSQSMGRLLTRLDEFADIIIFDTPPVVPFTDAAVLSTRMDGVVLVALAGQTSLDIVKQASQNLQQVGANLLGGILNGVASKEEDYYYETYYSSQSLTNFQQTNSLAQFFGLRRWWQRLPFFK